MHVATTERHAERYAGCRVAALYQPLYYCVIISLVSVIEPHVLAAPSFTEGGDSPMDLVIQLLKLAASAVGLATAMVKAVSAARGSRPETKADRKR